MASQTNVKPTLLAFHGSGSNDTVHTVQLARLMRVLKTHFEVESLQAPFPSPAGPGILPFFDGLGPFYRWLPPTEKVTIDVMKTGSSTSALAPEVEALVRGAVHRVRAAGGRVVGLVGFSQGTKVVAGLLRGAEVRRALGVVDAESDWLDFKCALSVCGSYPPPLVPGCVRDMVAKAGVGEEEGKELLGRKITTPTFHVLGEKDEWVWAGEGLVEGHYEVGEGKSRVVRWDMGHHYPVRPEESEEMAQWLVSVLEKREG